MKKNTKNTYTEIDVVRSDKTTEKIIIPDIQYFIDQLMNVSGIPKTYFDPNRIRRNKLKNILNGIRHQSSK